jgi:hypothetical protein
MFERGYRGAQLKLKFTQHVGNDLIKGRSKMKSRKYLISKMYTYNQIVARKREGTTTTKKKKKKENIQVVIFNDVLEVVLSKMYF